MPGADTAVMAQDMRDGKHVGLHVCYSCVFFFLDTIMM